MEKYRVLLENVISGVMTYLNYIFLKVLDVLSEISGKIYRVDAVSLKTQSRELKNCCPAIALTDLSRKKLRRVRYFVRVNFIRVQLISKISLIFLVILFLVNFS